MTATSASTGSRLPRVRWHGRSGHAFVAAYVVLLVTFGVVPSGYALYFAFTNAGGRFSGLANFSSAASDFRFVPAVGHVALYLLFWLVALVVFVVGPALLLQRLAARGISRTLRFVYYVAGRDYSPNQLSYDFAFQNNDVDTAEAISVELLLVGLVVAALFVVRSGFFDAD